MKLHHMSILSAVSVLSLCNGLLAEPIDSWEEYEPEDLAIFLHIEYYCPGTYLTPEGWYVEDIEIPWVASVGRWQIDFDGGSFMAWNPPSETDLEINISGYNGVTFYAYEIIDSISFSLTDVTSSEAFFYDHDRYGDYLYFYFEAREAN